MIATLWNDRNIPPLSASELKEKLEALLVDYQDQPSEVFIFELQTGMDMVGFGASIDRILQSAAMGAYHDSKPTAPAGSAQLADIRVLKNVAGRGDKQELDHSIEVVHRQVFVIGGKEIEF